MGPTRLKHDERRFPPDDPNDMLASIAHLTGLYRDYRELFTESGPFFSLAQVFCVYLEF